MDVFFGRREDKDGETASSYSANTKPSKEQAILLSKKAAGQHPGNIGAGGGRQVNFADGEMNSPDREDGRLDRRDRNAIDDYLAQAP